MNSWLQILTLALVMILPLSALRQRKLPGKTLALMALAWIAIFGLVAIAITAMAGG